MKLQGVMPKLIIGFLLFVLALATFGCTKPAPGPGPTPAPAPAKVFKWRLQSLQPPVGILYEQGDQEYFTDYIRKASNGRLDITTFPWGAIVPATEILAHTQKGTFEMGHTLGGYHGGFFKAGELMSSLLYDPRTFEEVNALWYNKGLLKWVRDIYAQRFNIHYLGNIYMPGRILISKVPVNTVADLKGLKIRVSGLPQNMYQKAGAAPTWLPASEIYTALQQGVINATGFGGFYESGSDLKLHEVTKYWMLPPIEGWLAFEVLVNLDAWKSLPDDLKGIAEGALVHANLRVAADASVAEVEWRHKVEAAGVKVIAWSDADVLKMRQFAMAAMEEYAKQDADALYVFQMYQKQLKELGY